MTPPPEPADPLAGRCGSCARFARVRETVDAYGVTRRVGDCLLAIWPPPLYETNTCGSYVARGTLLQRNLAQQKAAQQKAASRRRSTPRSPSLSRGAAEKDEGPP